MTDVSIIAGVVPVLVLIAGAAGLLFLLARRGRPALVTVAAAVGVALVAFLGINWVVTSGLNLFPEDLPGSVTAWLAVAFGGLVLTVGSLVGTSVRRKVTALVSGLAVVLAAGSQINIYFAQYPTLGALAGDADTGASPLTGAAKRPSRSEPTAVVDRWTGPATGAHFHGPAMPGANAAVVVPFTGPIASPITGTATLTDAQIADLSAGRWYINIHTAANPGGEIRGQVQ